MPETAAAASGEAAPGPSSSTEDSTRGRPYYEKLRRDLREALEKKRKLDQTLSTVETLIARHENSYLEETHSAGNIIKGFDNYMKASSSTGTGTASSVGTATRRKGGVGEQDRIFSRSSVSWNSTDSPLPSGGASNSNGTPTATPPNGVTPSVGNAAAGGGAVSNKGGPKQKKKVPAADKDKEDTDGDVERTTKRSKITWSRE